MSKQSEAVEPQYSQVHRLIIGDALTVLRSLADESVDLCVTSSPYYGLRDYGANCSTVWGGVETCEHQWISETVDFDNLRKGKGAGSTVFNNNDVDAIRTGKEKTSNFCLKCGAWRGQLGLEPTFQLFIDHLLLIFREVKRVLKSTGSLYFNIGDTYCGGKGKSGAATPEETDDRYEQGETLQKAEYEIGTDKPQNFPQGNIQPKCLLGIPERLMIRLIDEQGWVCRNKNIWYKRNHMPSSVQDRYANSYEPVLFFSKQSEKDLLWRNALTKEWVDVKPVQKYVENGELHDSYRWWCHRCKASGDDFKGRRKHKRETGHRTEGRKPLWRGFDCYFDLDAIRIPHTVCGVTDKRPMGVLRQKLYKGSRYNKSSDPHLAQYQGKFEGAGESAEAFGSPRARTQRARDKTLVDPNARGLRQAPEPSEEGAFHPLGKNPGDVIMTASDRKEDILDGEDHNAQPNNRSSFGIGSVISDRYKDSDVRGNAQGKNPGDVLDVSPETRPKEKLGVPSRFGTGDEHPTKNQRFFAEGGKNPGDFMDVTTHGFKESHFAVYPEALISPFIKASCPVGGVVLDPFGGSGTTAKVARDLGRSSICIEINPEYEALWHNRLDTSNTLDIKYVVEKQEKKQN